jgi:hypothetical protein
MGVLIDRIGLRMLVDGNGLVDNFKNNSLYFYDKYLKSDDEVRAIDIKDINPGGFYHFHYADDSNWMKWSPVFVADYKKVYNQIIVFAVNFNFIPLQIRAFIFDNFILEKDFEKDRFLKVNYEGIYSELLRYGYEYSLVEYNAIQLKLVHKIQMDLVPRFLISAHPKNKYDPEKLKDIWESKLEDKAKRNEEIVSAMLNEFYDVQSEIKDKYVLLRDHIKRLQTSAIKYGNKW